jgi:hypothetical protein
MRTPKSRSRSVKFEVHDPMKISMALGVLGIAHHYAASPAHREPTVMTAYYDTIEEAGKLFVYLVQHASVHDRVLWQQDHAHREIEGWCELCEVVNSGECDGGCLINDKVKNPHDFLFLRSVTWKP